MQAASAKYKEAMKEHWRNGISHLRVTIGMVNQTAQASAFIPDAEACTYFSNLQLPFENETAKEIYATAEQNFAKTDGSLFFLPRNKTEVALNAGIVSKELLGSIEVRFPLPLNIKGLTIDFGQAYPVDFDIESEENTVFIRDNQKSYFVTEEVFLRATYLHFIPKKMENGTGRLRIQQITMGIGIYFDNKKILSASKKEFISPIGEELPAIDFDLTIDNKGREFDVENYKSSLNFLEIGQKIEVIYGFDVEQEIEWIQGAVLRLKEWSTDDNTMQFSAFDGFEVLDGVYYKGTYYADGISLYELAESVFLDAEITGYWIDPYLKNVKVQNPMPPVTHKEALQIIANAGRCLLGQNRFGQITIKSSFIPEMQAKSVNETYFSSTGKILDKKEKESYAFAAEDYTNVKYGQYFLPRQKENALNTGYVSLEVANSDGLFHKNPTVEISAETAFKCFGITLEFGANPPEAVKFHAFYNEKEKEVYEALNLEKVTVIEHEFTEFDYLILEFTKGCPNNRVSLQNIYFGESTDYKLEYGAELLKTPKGKQLQKVKELQVYRTIYELSMDTVELKREKLTLSGIKQHTIYLDNPASDYQVHISAGTVRILDSSVYFVLVEISGVNGEAEVVLSGKEYILSRIRTARSLNPIGITKTWENPLVSEEDHAADLAKWIGNYMLADIEYELEYRGEPRIDANDILFLENKCVDNLLIRAYDHTLNFNGVLSGSIKARRDYSGVAAAKNRLAGK